MGGGVGRRAVLTVLTAAGLALGLGVGAAANDPHGGAPQPASDACSAALGQQQAAGLEGGGRKGGGEAPINCDHYWQHDGYIGRDFTPEEYPE